MGRREQFEDLYRKLGRGNLARNLDMMRGAMMDLEFDEKDINMAWYLSKAAPEAFSEAVAGNTVDLDRMSDELAARTRLDRGKLRSFLEDLV